MRIFASALLLLFSVTHGNNASKILVISPSPFISHQKPFHVITKALLRRGHEVTFLTANPLKLSHENLTELDLSIAYNIFRTVDLVSTVNESLVAKLSLLRDPPNVFVPWQFNEPVMQNFINENHTFDLVVMEWLLYQSYAGLVHRVGSPPQVAMMTQSALAPIYHSIGNTMNPAVAPEAWVGFTDHMSFWQRVYNAYFYLQFYYMWFWQLLPTREPIMRKYFGPDPPSVYEAERNFSLLIVNNHFCLEYPRPHLPNVVEITGIHVETRSNPLPKDMQEFMDGAEHGVIYFSLGSSLKGNALPRQTVQAFLEAFRELPQRVLWKWENDSLLGQPHNVMVSKWLPQQDVLAHPNVRLFITQGGLQSLNEATFYAVPLLVVPFHSDQAHNAAKVQQEELGLRLEFYDITKDAVLSSSLEVLQGTKYRENMRRLSAIFREHKAESVERAVWWVEYVIRHKGAPHMRSAALDLHWWQLLLLDVIALALLSMCTITYAAFYLARKIITVMKGSSLKDKI